MYSRTITSITRTAIRPATRSFHISQTIGASKPAHEPASTQGHTVDKAHTTLHGDSDVQSASTLAGQDARQKSKGQDGENEPFDAARQGQSDGEKKGRGATGPFADQIGGQDEPHKGPGVTKGGSTPAAGYNFTETIKNKVEGFLGQDKRNFSTSSRQLDGTTPRTDPDGARKPKDNKVQGDQNAHLKHTEGGSQGSAKTGNASPDPSLPSKNKSAQSGQTRSFSTSFKALADPNAPGVNSPQSGQREAQTQAGMKQQPRGDDTQHGGAAGEPSRKSQGASGMSPDPASETNAPDPGIPKGQKEGATKEGMGVRKFSTFSSVRAANPPGGYAKAVKHESNASGFDAPSTTLPSGLKSAYKEQDPSALESAPADLTPSSKAQFSSSAVDPPNEALKKQVLNGTMPEKNPQPDSEFGRIGLKEAWKHRNIS